MVKYKSIKNESDNKIIGYYDVRDAVVSLLDMLKYDAIQGTDGVICKDMGSYVQMLVLMQNSKGHDTYEVYMRPNGTIEKVVGHNGNS